MRSLGRLNSNAIKGIGLISMLTDHVGFFLFPEIIILRVIGRLAFPIFAFFIAQGCKHTKNKWKYFSTMAVLGIICTQVSYLATKIWYGNVFVTFSFSILVIYCLQWVKSGLVLEDGTWKLSLKMIPRYLALAALIFAIGVFGNIFDMDYGFYGVLLPVFASLFDKEYGAEWKNMLLFTSGLLLLAKESGGIQYYSLFALPILVLYNGKRGKTGWKYAFYIFYPLHVAILQGISMLL